MTTVNDFSGNFMLSAEFPQGFGQLISQPQAKLSGMIQDGLYYMEAGLDADNLFLNVEGYLVSGHKTLSFQKLMAQYVLRMTRISGHNKIRAVHRSLALSLDLQTAFRSVGEHVQIPDDFSNLTALNQALAPLYVQIYQST